MNCSVAFICIVGLSVSMIKASTTLIREKRIVKGSLATDRIPYVVSIQYCCGLYNLLKLSYCGGSLISQWHVLTAAHCLPKPDKMANKPMRVRAGSNLSNKNGLERRVLKAYPHEMYNRKYHFNDIAVLLLTKEMPLDEVNITIVPMFPQRDGNLSPESIAPGTPAQISGWGLTTTKGGPLLSGILGLSYKLRYLDVIVIDSNRCSECFMQMKKLSNRDGHICASMQLENSVGFVGAGDSGGPLVVDGQVAGVLSTGADGKCPDVFTEVAFFREWIDNVTSTKLPPPVPESTK